MPKTANLANGQDILLLDRMWTVKAEPGLLALILKPFHKRLPEGCEAGLNVEIEGEAYRITGLRKRPLSIHLIKHIQQSTVHQHEY